MVSTTDLSSSCVPRSVVLSRDVDVCLFSVFLLFLLSFFLSCFLSVFLQVSFFLSFFRSKKWHLLKLRETHEWCELGISREVRVCLFSCFPSFFLSFVLSLFLSFVRSEKCHTPTSREIRVRSFSVCTIHEVRSGALLHSNHRALRNGALSFFLHTAIQSPYAWCTLSFSTFQ